MTLTVNNYDMLSDNIVLNPQVLRLVIEKTTASTAIPLAVAAQYILTGAFTSGR
ncbi:TPA: hypothetical protein ACIPUI_001498 [Citrobacter freundii]